MNASKISRWSTSIARLILSIGLLLAAWLLATCGAPSGDVSNASSTDRILIEYQRTGGIAGFDDHLVIRANGEATLEQKGGRGESFTLDESTLSELRQSLDEAGFFGLNGQYRAANVIPDALQYRVTYRAEGRRHTVETANGAVPEQLAPVLDVLNRIIAEHMENR